LIEWKETAVKETRLAMISYRPQQNLRPYGRILPSIKIYAAVHKQFKV